MTGQDPREGVTSVTSAWLVVVDAANVVGSRPDGWWRDRVGAARRLLDKLAQLPGRTVTLPDGRRAVVAEVVAVVEGAAVAVRDPEAPGLTVARAARDGDGAIVEVTRRTEASSCLVVTADRGLRARLPCAATGPTWLLSLLPDDAPAP